jgi:hypothetical protein
MNRPVRDAAALVTAFVIGTSLLIYGLHSVGLVPKLANWPHEEWDRLGFLALSEVFLLTRNLRSLRRGEFRWYREPVVTVILLILLTLLILPVWGTSHELELFSLLGLRIAGELRRGQAPATTAIPHGPDVSTRRGTGRR